VVRVGENSDVKVNRRPQRRADVYVEEGDRCTGIGVGKHPEPVRERG